MKIKNNIEMVTLTVSAKSCKGPKNADPRNRYIMIDLTAWDDNAREDDIQCSMKSVVMRIR